ncbi:hypothetical protein K438DRAFT_371492 [Mycena galopus ATCC 62051]|nr:hypothetical protein K438DRAFT_371492 [Mycena galopus ATCC 62051]
MLSHMEADPVRLYEIEAQLTDPGRSLSALRAQRMLVQQRLDDIKYPVLTLPNERVCEILFHAEVPSMGSIQRDLVAYLPGMCLRSDRDDNAGAARPECSGRMRLRCRCGRIDRQWGYCWKTNQFGLTSATVTALNLVKRCGKIVSVTASSDPDLFFGLKGGLSNFEIVKTLPQGQVWDGLIIYTTDQIPAVGAEIAKFGKGYFIPSLISKHSARDLECHFLR